MAFASYLLPVYRTPSHKNAAIGHSHSHSHSDSAAVNSGGTPVASRTATAAAGRTTAAAGRTAGDAASTAANDTASGLARRTATLPAGHSCASVATASVATEAAASGSQPHSGFDAAVARDIRFLPRVVFLGRALEDYQEMFSLGDAAAELAGKRVLDVAAGSAAFATQAQALGIKVTAVDPCYGVQPDALDKISRQDQEVSFAALMEHADQVGHIRHTGQAGHVDEAGHSEQSGRSNRSDQCGGSERRAELVRLRAMRELARQLFLRDYLAGLAQGRYVKGELPHLPFADDSFDCALCGHFLFLYAHLFDEGFHRKAIAELLRVARQVRIYPLLGLDGVMPAFAETLLAELAARGDLEIRRVPMASTVLGKHAEGLILTKISG